MSWLVDVDYPGANGCGVAVDFPMKKPSELSRKFASILPFLDERARRLVVANEARSLGYGGVSIACRASGLSRKAIANGIAELTACVSLPVGRIRRDGAGRKSITVGDPGLKVEKIPGRIEAKKLELKKVEAAIAERESKATGKEETGGRMRVFDVEKLTELRSWPVPIDCHHLTADDRGRLWTVAKTPAKDYKTKASFVGAVVLAWNKDGSDTGLKLEGLDTPQTVAWDGTAKRLLIGTAGDTDQVLLADVSGAQPKIVGTFGVKGGVWSEPRGSMGPGRFRKITAIAVDAQGNRFISCDYGNFGSGHSAVDIYGADNKRRCFVYNNSFCESAVIDPQDETAVYQSRARFKMDWSKTKPGSEATWEALTLDNDRDIDGRCGSFTEPVSFLRIAGKPFLTYCLQPGGSIWINRFEGQVAVPCAYLGTTLHMFPGVPPSYPGSETNKNFPDAGGWPTAMWVDRNGDKTAKDQPNEYSVVGNKKSIHGLSFSFATDGSLWFFGTDDWGGNPQAQMIIGKVPCEGLDERGVPRWDFTKRVIYPTPAGVGGYQGAAYDDTTDSLYLKSETGQRSDLHHLTRWDGISTGKPVRAWQSGRVPWQDTAHTPGLGYGGGNSKNVRVAGKHLFLSYGWSSLVSIWDKDNGAYIGTLVPIGIPPNFDGALDAAYGHSAYLKKDGEYIVFAEAAGCGRVNMYRWKPTADLVGTSNLTVTADGKEPAIVAAWAMTPGTERWLLERKGGIDGDWRQVAELPAKTLTWRDTTTWAGTVYEYRLLAVKGAYVSAPSFVAYTSTMDPDRVAGEHIGFAPQTATALDGDVTTCVTQNQEGLQAKLEWVGLDAGKPVLAKRARVIPADIYDGRNQLAGGKIQGAQTPEGPWTDLSVELGAMPVRQWTDIPLQAPEGAAEKGAFRCFRLLRNNGAFLAEFSIVTTAPPTVRLTPGEAVVVKPGQEVELVVETPDKPIRVEFSDHRGLIGVVEKPPYRLRWKVPADAGTGTPRVNFPIIRFGRQEPPETGPWVMRAAVVTSQGRAGWSGTTVLYTQGTAALRLDCKDKGAPKGPGIPGWSVDGRVITRQADCLATEKPIDLSTAVNPAPMELYRTCYIDPREISVAGLVPWRRYVIRLHFAEIKDGILAEQRRFSVEQSYGLPLMPMVDLVAQAGGAFRAQTRTCVLLVGWDGKFSISFKPLVKGQAPPCLSGIEVIDPLGLATTKAKP